MRSVITTANLVVGADGSTTLAGSSIGLSTDEDRRRFHELRSKNDLILIGGNTARREPYKRTPIPLYILTHTKVRLQPKNQLAKQFALTPAEMINELKSSFNPDKTTPINLLVEAGPVLLQNMIKEGLIENLYLTVNLEKTGENSISIKDLTNSFELISREHIAPCDFFFYKKLTK
ncbi:MAG: RibD family protein [Candidatus Nanopelagicus sp.]